MSFTENNHNGLIYMSSDKIGARHVLTTRYGGVSTGIFSSLNLGSNRGRRSRGRARKLPPRVSLWASASTIWP